MQHCLASISSFILDISGYQMQITPELLIGSLIGLFTAFLWAISTNVYKTQGKEATPIAIAALKMWAAMAFMTFIVMLPFRTTPFYVPFETLVVLATSVGISLVVGDMVYLTAQERIGVSYAFPIASIYPISTYIIAIFFIGETIIISRFVGIIVAVVGVSLLSREQAANNEFRNMKKFDALGIGLSLIAALCWSLGGILLQIGVAEIEPIDANFVRMLFGGAIFVPVVLTAINRGMPKPTRRATKIIVGAGFLGMTLGSLLYTYAVKLTGASIAALLGSTSPLFAVPISIFLLKESFSRRSIFAVLLTVIGVALVILAV
ncbi:MAG: DMT family transporter [Candidatus Thorarchaeota archaeon]|nr:MAG: DMT family transporter [Candidatus Thorarchaeota archaeon]